MQKSLRLALGLILSLVILAIAGAIAAVTFFNPNDFRPQISRGLSSSLGRPVVFQGNIEWSFFPWLGFKVEKVTLQNPSGFQNPIFATLQKGEIKIELFPLFRKKIAVDEIILKNLDLNLIKNADGVGNWETPTQSTHQNFLAQIGVAAPKGPRLTILSTNDTVPETKNFNLDIKVEKLVIDDGKISWTDQKSKAAYTVNHLAFDAERITLGKPFPFNTQFQLTANSPSVTGNIALHGSANINVKNKIYQIAPFSLKADLTGTSLPGNTLSLDTSGSFNFYSGNTNLTLDNYTAHLMGNTVTGNGRALDLLGTPIISGNASIAEWQNNKLHASQIQTHFTIKNKQINLKPLSAKIFGGNYLGQLQINLQNAMPAFVSDSQFSNIQAGQLFFDLTDITFVQLNGLGNLTVHLTMSGTTQAQIIKSLNGGGQLGLRNGVIKGINLPYWISVGKALFNKQIPPTSAGPNQTNFGNVTGNFTIQQGILKNQDLLLQTSGLKANGQGTVNLVAQNLDYRLILQPLSSTDIPQGTAIPLQIKGPFSKLTITPDIASLLKAQIEQQMTQQKENVTKKIGDALEKKLGPGLSAPIQQELQQLLQ